MGTGVKGGSAHWKLGLRLAVGALLLVWIFHTIFVLEGSRAWRTGGRAWEALPRLEQWRIAWGLGPVELWRSVTLVTPGALAASLVFMGMTILLGVIRWRMVLRIYGLDLSFGRAAEISLVAQFFNSFLLGSTGGDLLKAYYAARETHHKKTEAVVTVLVDRVLGLFAMLAFAGMMMLPNLALLGAHRRLAALAAVILAMLLGCGGVIVLSLWGGLSRRFPAARAWLRRLPKGANLERALEASRQVGREPLVLAKVLGISMLLNVCCVLQIVTLAAGLGIQIQPLALFVFVPVIVCISALPITPSGLGVRENLYVLMLAAPEINIAATSALSLSLLAYGGFLFWSVLGGLVYVTRRERDRLAEIAVVEPAEQE